jgi:7-cyano-7-deazaguanine synthase in queuosine biosynthesis
MLHDGSMQSLVATAMYAEKPKLLAVYVHDGRSNDVRAFECFGHQIERYNVPKRLELTLTHLGASADAATAEPGVGPRVPLADMQELMAGAGLALQLKAERLIWPVQVGDDFEVLARMTESVLLVQQIIRLERSVELAIDLPLLEMNDRQLVEVGMQMEVPWTLSRSCEARTSEPCGQCAGCKRRAAAFEAAAIDDPLQLTARA